MKNLVSISAFLTAISLLQSCATIVGGSTYNANVIVRDHPQATITYKGQLKGTGIAFMPVKRKEANTFSITVKEEGCEAQTINFTSRSFRGGAFVGTVIGFTGLASGILIPYGLAVDMSTGALWKPNIKEPGIVKTDFKNYTYVIDYNVCSKALANKNE